MAVTVAVRVAGRSDLLAGVVSASKRVRWECPRGLHPAVLGSTRPLAEAAVRFCLPCSEADGKLVRRVAPALERKRAAKTAVRQTKQQRERERDRLAAVEALRVTVLDYGAGETVLDAGELLREAWASETLRAARRDHGLSHMGVPALTIRHGSADRGRAARERAGGRPERERDTVSGHSKYGSGAIVLTVAPGLGREWLEAVIVHEAAHSALPDGERHGRTWRATYIRAMRELHGVMVSNTSQASWRLDEDITMTLREAARP